MCSEHVIPSEADGVDKDIHEGIKAARHYAESVTGKIGSAEMAAIGFGGPPSVSECSEKLHEAFRMASELRRQIDHLHTVLKNRQGRP